MSVEADTDGIDEEPATCLGTWKISTFEPVSARMYAGIPVVESLGAGLGDDVAVFRLPYGVLLKLASEVIEDGSIGNLGSNIGEYGEELFKRDLDELIFRAAAWATGTQLVRFSNGANEMIDKDRGDAAASGDDLKERVVPNPDFDPALHGHPDAEEEQLFELRQSHVTWREIDDASHLDPPKSVPANRPRRRTRGPDLSVF